MMDWFFEYIIEGVIFWGAGGGGGGVGFELTASLIERKGSGFQKGWFKSLLSNYKERKSHPNPPSETRTWDLS